MGNEVNKLYTKLFKYACCKFFFKKKRKNEKREALPGRKHIESFLFASHHHKQSMAPSLMPM